MVEVPNWWRRGLRRARAYVTKKPFMEAELPDLKSYIGRTVVIKGRRVEIVSIKGNMGLSMGREMMRPQYLEINGQHLISMLRFFAQMNGATDITEEQFRAFEEMDCAADHVGGPGDPLMSPDILRYKPKPEMN